MRAWRCSEPLQLDRDDVDLVHGVLTVRGVKFGKSRYVPLHSSTQRVLHDYAAQRDRLCRAPESPSFFLSERGIRLTEWAVRRTFAKLSLEIGLPTPANHEGLACMISTMQVQPLLYIGSIWIRTTVGDLEAAWTGPWGDFMRVGAWQTESVVVWEIQNESTRISA